MRVKICGITQVDQGISIAQLGATALGFICVPQSPRYVLPAQIRAIVEQVPPHPLSQEKPTFIGVFANASLEEISQVVSETGLTGIQLHGQETPEFCQSLRQHWPQVEVIKALRVKNAETLATAATYAAQVHTLLLDAYHPDQLGGTGQTIDWQSLRNFRPPCPWLLAGGLSPSNIVQALSELNPDGIDLSSGVEQSPGNKDLNKVAQLFEQLKRVEPKHLHATSLASLSALTSNPQPLPLSQRERGQGGES